MNRTFFVRNRYWLLLLLLGLFSGFTRLWNFHLFPAALTHDEVVYAIQSRSFAIQGTSLNQMFYPWSFQPAHPMYAELPAVLMTPFFVLFSDPIVATRLLAILVGVLLPFVLGWWSYGLFQNKKLSLLVIAIATANPLLWQMSRLTYDAVLSTFFYLLAGAILLNVQGKKVLWASLFLFLGFFQYQGYKLLLVPWILILAVLIFYKKWTSKKFHWGVLGSGIIVFIAYSLVLLPNQVVENRWKQTIFAHTEFQTQMVNSERRLVLDNPFSFVVSNKLTATVKYMTKRFIEAYSPYYLFVEGEPGQSPFSAWGYGWFHYVDAFLILLGIGFSVIDKKHRRTIIALGALILMTSLPATLNAGESWYLLRMFFPNVMLILFIAWGALSLWHTHILTRMGLVLIYPVFISLFMYHYYYRYPVLGLRDGYFYERIMVEYLDRYRMKYPEKRMVVYTIDPPVMFWTYLLYTQRLTADTVNTVAAAENTKNYVIDTITFTTDCVDLARTDALVIAEPGRAATPCDHKDSVYQATTSSTYAEQIQRQRGSSLSIPSVVDSGGYWRIFNNELCNPLQLGKYVTLRQLAQLKTREQSDESFCKQWLVTTD